MFGYRSTMFGILLLAASAGRASAAVLYVDAGATNATPPYLTWATAAATIQQAVDSATPGDEIFVTNGLYAAGGRAMGTNILLNRVAVDKPLTLRSVNGPSVTVIKGYKLPTGFLGCGDGAVRCVALANGASLVGFTLSNGATRIEGDFQLEQSGGGVWSESQGVVVSNCVITFNGAWFGGGACGGFLNDCILTNNAARTNGGAIIGSRLNGCVIADNSARFGAGGGVYSATLDKCMLTGNFSDPSGGGASASVLNDCILSSNSAKWNGGGASESTLNNCVLTNNTSLDGGGASVSTLSNCSLAGNSAGRGGGASYSRLHNSTLIGNRATRTNFWDGGGGAYDSILVSCTVVSNSAAGFGGGVATNPNSNPSNRNLTNCIVYFNTASYSPNYGESYLDHCCAFPMPFGSGNITNPPLFLDYDGRDLRPQSNSPCINAGRNLHAPGAVDRDGVPRLVSGTEDIGAYEYQGAGSVISYAWLQRFGLPTDGSADSADPDADGHSNLQEWRSQTDPTSAFSALRLLSAAAAGSHVSVTWQSVPGVRYFLQRAINLSASSDFALLATNLPGQPNTTSYVDTNAANAPLGFYRVGVAN